MNEPKTHCSNCGRQILQRTADRKSGLCTPCHDSATLPPPEPIVTPAPPVDRATLDQLIATKSPHVVIDVLFVPACDKVNFRPEEMTEGDIIVYTVWTFIGERDNGGIIQYFHNQSGGWAHLCGPSLRRIGAVSVADIIEQCIADFTSAESPNDPRWFNDLEVYVDAHDPPFPKTSSDAPTWEKDIQTYERGKPFYDAEQKLTQLHEYDELSAILYAYIVDNRDVFAPYEFGGG